MSSSSTLFPSLFHPWDLFKGTSSSKYWHGKLIVGDEYFGGTNTARRQLFSKEGNTDESVKVDDVIQVCLAYVSIHELALQSYKLEPHSC